MKTSLVIDDELYRRVKAKAALEGRRLTDLVEDGLRCVLSGGSAVSKPAVVTPRRVQLPLVPARPGEKPLFEGMSSEAIHERLAELQSEVDRISHDASLRHEPVDRPRR